MIDPHQLHVDIVSQDDKLRQILGYWAAPNTAVFNPDRAVAEILSEGLAAIHERLGNIAEILAVTQT